MRDMFEEMKRMQSEMDRLFNEFFMVRRPLLAGPRSGRSKQKGEIVRAEPSRAALRAPVSDITETETAVIATFELPGAQKENIKLNVTENALELKAEKKTEKEVKQQKEVYYSFASSATSFYRRIPLPAAVEPDKTVAVYKDGMLKVTMQKARQPNRGRLVEIK